MGIMIEHLIGEGRPDCEWCAFPERSQAAWLLSGRAACQPHFNRAYDDVNGASVEDSYADVNVALAVGREAVGQSYSGMIGREREALLALREAFEYLDAKLSKGAPLPESWIQDRP